MTSRPNPYVLFAISFYTNNPLEGETSPHMDTV